MHFMDTTKGGFKEMKSMLIRSQCVLKYVYFFWERNPVRDFTVSSFLDGILLCTETKIQAECYDTHSPPFLVDSMRGSIKLITVAPYNP